MPCSACYLADLVLGCATGEVAGAGEGGLCVSAGGGRSGWMMGAGNGGG